MPDFVPFSQIARVNPPLTAELPEPYSPVSFIPMADVSDTGEWTTRQTRRLLDIGAGYTPFQEDDVLFAKITPCMENGKGCHARRLVNGVGFGSTEFHVLRVRGENSPRFIYHWSRFELLRKKAETAMSGSAGQQRVEAGFFDRFLIPELSPKEQSRIAETLDTLDAAIWETEAVIAKLRQVKAGLLHDLLARGLDKHGHLRDPARHPEQFHATLFGRLPKAWDVILLDEVAVRGSGHTPDKSRPHYWNGGVKWVSLADSDKLDRVYISTTAKEISEAGILNSSAVKHPPGVVILSRDAGIGKSAITTETMAVSQHFMAWRCGHRLDNHFLYYWFQFRKSDFESIAMGSTIKTIGLDYFRLLQVPVPKIQEQRRIGQVLLAADTQLFEQEEHLSKLHSLKRGLAHDLLTGRVRVKMEGVA